MTQVEQSSERELTPFISFGLRTDRPIAVEEITAAFGVPPTSAIVAGERYFESAIGEERVHPWSVWSWDTEKLLDAELMREHAQLLLDTFEPALPALQRYLDDPEVAVSIRFWFETIGTHGGFDLDSQTAMRLSRLCNEMVYTFVSTYDDEDDEV